MNELLELKKNQTISSADIEALTYGIQELEKANSGINNVLKDYNTTLEKMGKII